MNGFDDDFDAHMDEIMDADFTPQKVQHWRTQDGRVMRMSDMTDSHLANARAYTGRRIDDIEERIKTKAAQIIEEPLTVTTHGRALAMLGEELTEVVVALRLLKAEHDSRNAYTSAAADLRREIDDLR